MIQKNSFDNTESLTQNPQLKSQRTQLNQIQPKFEGKMTKFKLNEQIVTKNVLQDYKNIFLVQSKLFQYLNSRQAFYIRAQELRHPLIFYYGHTMTMYINKFVERGILTQRVNQKLQTMFAIGVDQMDWDDLDQKHYDWPTLQEVTQYREKVNLIIIQIISSLKDKKVSANSLIWDILMSMQHHRVHIQTSAAIIRRVPIFYIKQVPQFKQCPIVQNNVEKIPKNQMISINQYNFDWKFNKNNISTYLFDNQIGQAKSFINSFQISKFQVSNGEFLAFIEDQGYQKPQYWSNQGQAWLKSKKRSYPIYWYVDQDLNTTNYKNDKRFKLKTMSKIIDMPWNWPVEVNHLEAEAFCKWKSLKQNKNIRLPTQQEFFAARDQFITNIYSLDKIEGNYNRFHWFSPCPVDMFKNGEIYNIVGNVWDHTRTPFHPFSGFKIQQNFQDYSAPYFGDQHSLLFGGSFASGLKDVFVTRNWFRHHFYNFIGFRYTISTNQNISYSGNEQIDFFDYDNQTGEQIQKHYFSKESYIFKANNWLKENNYFIDEKLSSKVLIIGGSVGRLALQYSQNVDQVIGIDYSAKLFKFATKFLSHGQLRSLGGVTIKLEEIKPLKKNNLQFLICNPENPDYKKLNGFNIILVDGKGLRPNRLREVLKNISILKHKTQVTKLIVITSKLKSNIFVPNCLLNSKINTKVLEDQEDVIQMHVFEI